jgi:S-adenosylmethionine:tRNA ribosyltransferase-isomerase
MARHGRVPLPPYIERAPAVDDQLRYQTVYAERAASVAAPTAGLHFTTSVLDSIRERGVRIVPLELEIGPGTFKPVESPDYRNHPMHAERFHIPAATASAINDARGTGAVWAVGTTVVRALESAADSRGAVRPGPGETRLMIAPGYAFKVVTRLLTNFHLPRSTLLMLVAAFAGYELTMSAYRHAIEQRYRFYSYGDAMAIL